jgi:transposase
MINADPTLGNHFFNVPQAQRIGDIPAYAHQDHVERVMQALEHSRHSWIQALLHSITSFVFTPLSIADGLTATEPYFLPPYSPELNRIEKLWHKMKYEWLAFKARDTQTLEADVDVILQGFGADYRFTFC